MKPTPVTIPAAEISYFTHGTTVGVNTVIQRNGHDLALGSGSSSCSSSKSKRRKITAIASCASMYAKWLPMHTRGPPPNGKYAKRGRVLATSGRKRTVSPLNDAVSVRRLLLRLRDDGRPLRVAYEAGPTGYALHRQVAGLGIDCIVVAPSLIPVRPGEQQAAECHDAVQRRAIFMADMIEQP